MDFNSQDQPHQITSEQYKMTSISKQGGIFSHQIEKGLRKDFQSIINQASYIRVPCFSPTRYISSFDHDHQIISEDPIIKATFPAEQSRQEYQGYREIFEEVDIKRVQQDIRAKVKSFEDELIVQIKQLHPYFSEKQLQQAQQNVVQFWQSHEVKPSAVGKILKQCVKTLLLYQAYHNSNLFALQRKGILRDIREKYATILDFVAAKFDIENEKLDKIIPLEKQYFIFRHLNFESFPDHQFHITQQSKKSSLKKEKARSTQRSDFIIIQ